MEDLRFYENNSKAKILFLVLFAAWTSFSAYEAFTKGTSYNWWISLVIAFLFFYRTGTEIDIGKNRFRRFLSIGPFRFGKWDRFNEPQKIRVQKISRKEESRFHLFLDTANAKHKLFDLEEFQDVKRKALDLSSRLKLPLVEKY